MRILSKFCAVLLIVLAVSPVTAPFAACDLAALVGDGGGGAADSKILKESTTVATLDYGWVPAREITAITVAVLTTVAQLRQTPTILRL